MTLFYNHNSRNRWTRKSEAVLT